MKKSNVKRMPYRKTIRREQQLEWEQCEKDLRDGNRKALLQFVGLTLSVLLIATGIIYLTTLVPDVVYSFMGVDK